MTTTTPTPRYVFYVLAGVVLTVIALMWACVPPHSNRPNGSSDGKFHTCGYVTEDGVTENLDAYHERCPETMFSFGPDYVCEYDDMLALELKADALGHKAGEVVCMHIDELNDYPAVVDVPNGERQLEES